MINKPTPVHQDILFIARDITRKYLQMGTGTREDKPLKQGTSQNEKSPGEIHRQHCNRKSKKYQNLETEDMFISCPTQIIHILITLHLNSVNLSVILLLC